MADAEVLPERYDPFSPAALDDPYPFYEDLRRVTPVGWLSTNQVWVLTRYDDVLRAWNDPVAFSSVRGMGIAQPQFLETGRADGDTRAMPLVSTGRSLVASDPPVHARLRQLIAPLFEPDRLARLSRDVVVLCERLVDDLLERPAGTQDLVSHLARPLPVLVVARVLGIPLDRADDLARWSDELNGLRQTDPAADTPDEQKRQRLRLRYEMWDFFENLVNDREARPGDDAVSQLVVAARRPGADPAAGSAIRGDVGNTPSRDDIIDLAALLLTASTATATGLMANLLHLLVQNGDRFGDVRRNPALLGPTIEEGLRFDPPIQGLFRWTTGAVRFGDVIIPANQAVWGIFASANRDESRFSQPDQFDPTRTANPHLGFGGGVHECVGQPLGRLMTRAVLETLAKRTSGIDTDGPPQRAGNPVLRSMAALPVRITAR